MDSDRIKERFWVDARAKCDLLAFLHIDYVLLTILECDPQVAANQAAGGAALHLCQFVLFCAAICAARLIAHWVGLIFLILALHVDTASSFHVYVASLISRDLRFMGSAASQPYAWCSTFASGRSPR